MDSRWRVIGLALAAFLVAIVAEALALGPEALCGPDDIECWDPYETTARMATWALGLATAGALLPALVRHRMAGIAAVPVALAGGFWLLVATMFSSPGSRFPCRFAWCPDAALVATAFSLMWGLVVASLLLHALRARPRRGATLAAGVALGLLLPAAGLVLSNHGGTVAAAAYGMLGLAFATAVASWALLRRPSGRQSP